MKIEPEPTIKLRERNVGLLWADKRVIRLFRKHFNKQVYKHLRTIYLAMCEIDSDFSEERSSKVKTIHNFTKTLCTYSGMDQGTVTPIARIIAAMGLVKYGVKKNPNTKQIIGSELIMYEYVDDDFHVNNLIRINPYKDAPLCYKNIQKKNKNEKTLKCQAPAVPQVSVSSIKVTDELDNTSVTPMKLNRRSLTQTNPVAQPADTPATVTKHRTNPHEVSINYLIKHWNSKSATRKLLEPKNGNAPTKTYIKVAQRYLPSLLAQDGYGTAKIETAINVYNTLLSDQENYVLRDSIRGHRVSFDVFLNGLPKNMQDRIHPSNPVGKKTVWLKECSDHNEEYLYKKYGVHRNDKDVRFTKEIMDRVQYPNSKTSAGIDPYPSYEYSEIKFQESIHIQNGEWSLANKNLCVLAANRLIDFLKVYGFIPDDKIKGTKKLIRWWKDEDLILWVKLLFMSISWSLGNSDYEVNLRWLSSVKTYEVTLPKYLKEHEGMMEKHVVPLEMPWKSEFARHKRK